MEVVHPRCAGIDISKKDAKVCVRIQGRGRTRTAVTVTTWGAMSNQILALRDHLLDAKVTCVVIEATSDYWKPFYYLLEDKLDVILVNARAVKNMPGRKSDVSDAAWLADLGAHGLVRASLVPPPPIRQLRDLTRARTVITRERSREAQRLEKLLEDAGVKLTSVVSNITGVSARAMLEALIEGEQDPAAIAELVHPRMRPKIPALTEALTGRFGEHHRFMTRLFLDRIDAHNADIARLDARFEAAMEPFRSAPGVADGHSGHIPDRRRVVHRRNRRRYERLPDRAASRIVVRSLPGIERVSGQGEIHQHPPRRPISQGCFGNCGALGGEAEEHLLLGEIPPDHRSTRTDARTGFRRTRHGHRRLAHAHQR